MPTFGVDTNVLADAAGSLRSIGAALRPEPTPGDPGVLGFPAAEAAVSAFVAAWQAGGAALSDSVELVGRHLSGAAADYESAERKSTVGRRRSR